MAYTTDCQKSAEAFSRFLAELRTMGQGFDGSDADLARAICESLPADSGFEATFDMIVLGYAMTRRVAA